MPVTVDKKQVQRNFGRSAATYDRFTVIQKAMAAELLAKTKGSGRRYLRILEIGCGTGFLTELLAREYPQAHIVALDIAPEMIQAAITRLSSYGGITYLVADGQNFQPGNPKPFDLIISNLVFQWFSEYIHPFTYYNRLLAEGGDFVFSTLGKGTFAELYSCLGRPAPFINPVDLRQTMEQAGFHQSEIISLEKKEYFTASRDFFRALRKTGAHSHLVGGPDFKGYGQEIFKLINEYDRRYGGVGGVTATYSCLLGWGKRN